MNLYCCGVVACDHSSFSFPKPREQRWARFFPLREAEVVWTHRGCPETCASREVAAYISAAQRIRWELTVGNLSPWLRRRGAGVLGPPPQSNDRFPAGPLARKRPAGQFHHALFSGGRLPHQIPGRGGDGHDNNNKK